MKRILSPFQSDLSLILQKFPALGSFNVRHDFLEEFHEQNRGTYSRQQGPITLELLSDYQPPTMLLNFPPLTHSSRHVYASDSRREEWLYMACRDQRRHLLCAKTKAIS
ncbi:hypothetical protein VNO77_34251 [Canavalia gladiata]|uniref:Uncharacterized protein n=1 Tax=Canavalia gladiata TaxID=3824 RepID=A0AAN9KH85_CANGL